MKTNEKLITIALSEDLMKQGDITSSAIFDKQEKATFHLFAKAQGIICGCKLFEQVMEEVDKDILVIFFVEDGSFIEKGTKVATISGAIASILTAERTALNFLAHLSGIATQTAKYVAAIKHTSATILDTRKTLPAYRKLEKYAVLCGGAKNHRQGLYDMVMIKDNHIDSAGSIQKAVTKIREKWQRQFPIEVEVRNEKELKEALACKVNRIMLDNMSIAKMQEAVKISKGAIPLEASGNITLDTVKDVAETGVDFISVGALTHSVKSFDFSLKKENNLQQKITQLKKELGNAVVLLGHHYQRPEIVAHCDFIGDSYGLAVEGILQAAKYIVFCGVRFMAEGAAILAEKAQKIILPDHKAGCPMANMITGAKAEEILIMIEKQTGAMPTPIVYMNSYADAKMICGKYEGAVCTSSNAEKILNYYFQQNKRVFFFPDQHLGVNTAYDMGLKKEQIAYIKPDKTIQHFGTLSEVKLFMYDGFCHVHQDFSIANITEAREKHPFAQIIVHPEVNNEVLNQADIFGSTEKIYNTVKNAATGTVWGIGTEINFVERLAASCPDKTIFPLFPSLCHNMAKITEEKLYATLKNIQAHIKEGKALENEITVTNIHKSLAQKSLQKMIDIVEN